jgi:hypothetical protein
MGDSKQSTYLKNRIHQQSSGMGASGVMHNHHSNLAGRGMLMNPVSESIEYQPSTAGGMLDKNRIYEDYTPKIEGSRPTLRMAGHAQISMSSNATSAAMMSAV